MSSTKHKVTATELQRESGKVLKRVAVGHEHLVVERDGYPVAVMLPYDEYEALMRARASEQHRQLVVGMGQAVEDTGLTEEQILDELERAKRQVYQERYGRARSKA